MKNLYFKNDFIIFTSDEILKIQKNNEISFLWEIKFSMKKRPYQFFFIYEFLE